MILYRFHGMDFGLCSTRCAKLFRHWPSERYGKPKPGVSNGCFWCGNDLTAETEWL